MAANVVEMIADPEECAFDQPCKHGHRVEGHAVYCHNDGWVDGPRKCRRSWYTGGEVKDEDCPGYQPNPEFRGAVSPTPVAEPRCSRCGGSKLIPSKRKETETCPRCMGDGAEPKAMPMTQYEQDTLEMGYALTGGHPGQYDYYVRIAETRKESDMVHRVADLDLVKMRSMSFTKGGATAYLLKLTAKGDAVMRANWDLRKSPAKR